MCKSNRIKQKTVRMGGNLAGGVLKMTGQHGGRGQRKKTLED